MLCHRCDSNLQRRGKQIFENEQKGYLIEGQYEICLFEESKFNWNIPSFYEHTESIGSVIISIKSREKRVRYAYLLREAEKNVEKTSDLQVLERISKYPIQ